MLLLLTFLTTEPLEFGSSGKKLTFLFALLGVANEVVPMVSIVVPPPPRTASPKLGGLSPSNSRGSKLLLTSPASNF